MNARQAILVALAAAAVVVVAVVGIRLLSSSSSSTSTSTSVTPQPSPSPTPAGVVFPEGYVPVGSHSLTVGGVPFSFSVPASGWERFGRLAGGGARLLPV